MLRCRFLTCCASTLAALLFLAGATLMAQSQPGPVWGGQSAGDQFGAALAAIDDLNGDGVTDILVGAPFDSSGSGGPGAGAVYALSGSDQSVLYAVYGLTPFVEFGRSLAVLGDINNDSIPDFAVGAPFDQLNGIAGGTVRFFSGLDGQALATFGGTTPGDRLGASVSAAGDVDGDGVPDVLLGAPGNDDFDEAAGAVYLRSGSDGSLIRTHLGAATNDVFGTSVCGLGDVNGDGCPDYLVGAPFEDANGLDAGRVRLFSGADGALLITIDGQSAGRQAGQVVAALDDLDDDEVPDFAVGSPSPANPAGALVRVYSGVSGELLQVMTPAVSSADAGLGTVVSAAGDFDGDNAGDILIGLPFFADSGGSIVGRAEVVSGRSGILLDAVNGSVAGGLLASALAPAGDINGDGFADFLAGVPGSGGLVPFAGSVVSCVAPSRPVLLYDSQDKGTGLLLSWMPDGGVDEAVTGTIICSGASPGGLGLFGVSLAPADIPLSFGFPLLIANDPVNLVATGFFGFDLAGALLEPGVSRQNAFLAGADLFIQFFESQPHLASSNGLRMRVAP